MKYKVYAKDELIGESELEMGDAPMGVAFGAMIPMGQYQKYQSIFEARDFEKIELLGLRVVAENGKALEPCSGIGIEDISKEAGEACIELSVLGLDSSIYEEYFAHHIAAYEAQFK